MKATSNKSHEMDLCEGSILKKMLLFTLPIMASGILQLLFNAADIVVVGRFAGENSMAAVGSNSALINLLTNVFMGLSVGGNVIVARYYGAKDDAGVHRTVHTSIFLAILSGIFLTTVGVIFAPNLLIMMKTPIEVLPLATIYLRIYFVGMTGMMVFNFGSALLRAVGDTRRPLNYLIISGVINVVLNMFFVIVLKMDVAGVALATVISQYVATILIVRCLVTESGVLKLELKKLHIYGNELKQIIFVGLPAGFQGVVFSLSNVVIQSSVNLFGNLVVSGNSAGQSLEGFVYMAMNSFHQSAVSFTSQNYGGGRKDRIDKILITALILVTATGLIAGWGMFLFAEPLLKIFSKNPVVVAAGVNRLKYILTTYSLCGIMDVIVGVSRGLGYSIGPMIISLIGACATRLIFIATVFQIPEFHKVETVYATYPISWTITIAAQLIFYLVIRKRVGIGIKKDA